MNKRVSGLTSFLECQSDCAVWRRQVEGSLSLCVPAATVGPEVQQKVHDVRSSAANCSVQRTVLTAAQLNVCACTCTHKEVTHLAQVYTPERGKICDVWWTINTRIVPNPE